MKVLVLGGTGAMGVHLVKLLSEAEIDCCVTSRKNRIASSGVRHIKGDAHQLEFLSRLLHEHWDAIVDFMVYTTQEFADRVQLLLNGTSQYVYLSSARVYAESESPITEDAPRLVDICQDKEYLATDEYALKKARQENILKTSGKSNWTIIRPYITYSEKRLQLGTLEKEEWLYRALHGRTIVFSSDIASKKTTLTYGRDVARGIISILGNTTALGEAFHITCLKSCRWTDVLNVYSKVLEARLGKRPKIALQGLEQFMRYRPAPYQVLYDRLFDRTFDSAKIAQFVDLEQFCPIESELQRCLEVFLEHPKFNDIDWKNEAFKDRQTSERAPLGEIKNFKQKLKYLYYRYISRYSA